MSQYIATSNDSRNFVLLKDHIQLGKLTYKAWYSFDAELELNDGAVYPLTASGFWDASILLKKEETILMKCTLGWKGIVLSSFLNGNQKDYLLTLKGLFSGKYVLIDSEESELLSVGYDFNWKKFLFDYDIQTTEKFDRLASKELMLLTALHGINYYLTFSGSA